MMHLSSVVTEIKYFVWWQNSGFTQTSYFIPTRDDEGGYFYVKLFSKDYFYGSSVYEDVEVCKPVEV